MNEEWDLEGLVRLIREGGDFKCAVTITPIMVQTQSSVEVTTLVPFEVKVAPPIATLTPFEVEVAHLSQ